MTAIAMEKDDVCCRYSFSFAGAVCELTSNSSALVKMLDRVQYGVAEFSGPRFAMDVVVDEASDYGAGRPHFRGMEQVAIATFGAPNVFVFDLLRQQVTARVSGRFARDAGYWQQKILPITIGVMGASIGVLPMHAACLAVGGAGMLIAGDSGAGKSTLSVAMAQNGFDYVSDDWTYMNTVGGRLTAHGTSAPVKLLPDARRHFRRLAEERIGESLNGEMAYEVDAGEVFGASVVRRCEPRWLIFLERFSGHGGEFIPLAGEEAGTYLEETLERLPERLTEAKASRARMIESISKLQCWHFRYGGSPQFAALLLHEFAEARRQEALL